MNEVYLFVGGAWDGKRERVPGNRDRINIPVQTSPSYVENYCRASLVDRWEHHTYELRYFRDGESSIGIYVHSEVAETGVLAMLVEGYRKQ